MTGTVGVAAVPPTRLRDKSLYENPELLAGLVRAALVEAGLGQTDPKIPLADIIKPGMSVLLKPNWVLHCNQGGHVMDCMVTHPKFILAALAEVLAARPGRVMIGDAPIQGAEFDKLATAAFRQRVEHMCSGRSPVEFVDFRRTVLERQDLVAGVRAGVRDEGCYVRFDLGPDSLLEPVSSPAGRFRVTMYDPRDLARTHQPGTHQYLICREAFATDVVLSLPKLKTHRKAGLTAALKNLVGLAGSKDFLPHHRVGGSAFGGDCYPGFAPIKRLAELALDAANRRIGRPQYTRWRAAADRLLRIHGRLGDCEMEGCWHGNDTVWRMVLDLNRILLYGRLDGTMAELPQRQVWSLTDAIVCGQGDGPLRPEPISLGAVTFSGSAPAADVVHAALLKMDQQCIPLVRESFGQFRWPLASHTEEVRASFARRILTPRQLATELGVSARPPLGWVGHCELSE